VTSISNMNVAAETTIRVHHFLFDCTTLFPMVSVASSRSVTWTSWIDIRVRVTKWLRS